MKGKPNTLKKLKESGYVPRSIKEELRENLIVKIEKGSPVFEGILGYDHSVIPDVQRAILAGHNINFLGLRGQAKTRMARAMTNLLDEYIPVVQGSDLMDDPLRPISNYALDLIEEKGDKTPIDWIHRSERYTEKLATPDVSVADLIGDVDPIKAANLKLDYSDERVIHFGLVPRSNRSIFVINELPDLQPRIQVALFNILQEGDIQIRGFKLRLPLDIQFVFTANPEDYTNRGAIVTPLKDRIQSQIITHYPRDLATSKQITEQEANLTAEQQKRVKVPELLQELVERISFEARESEYIDHKSGVSARLTISAYEDLVSSAERRALINKEKKTVARIGDLTGIIPAITGKVELVYEGEQEGAAGVARHLIGRAIRVTFPQYFPDPEVMKRQENNPYSPVIEWFSKNEIDLLNDEKTKSLKAKLESIDGLKELVNKYVPQAKGEDELVFMEFLLHGLSEYSIVTRDILEEGMSFKDILNSVFSGNDEDKDHGWG